MVTLGIPLAALTKIRLAAFIVGVFSAKASNSWLPHSQDSPAGRVDLSKLAPVVLIAALASGAVTLSGCGAATGTPALSPNASVVHSADQIVLRLEELQNAVISTNALSPGAIPYRVAVPLVQFCVESAKVLKASQNGVLPAVAAEWRTLRASIPPEVRARPSVVAAFLAVDLALAEFGSDDRPAARFGAGLDFRGRR